MSDTAPFEGAGSPSAEPIAVGQVVRLPASPPQPSLTVRPGDELSAAGYDERWPGYVLCGTNAGHSGWLPESVLFYLAPGIAVVRNATTTAVLNVTLDERLGLHAEANGWYWATNAAGQAGWVLAANVKVLAED